MKHFVYIYMNNGKPVYVGRTNDLIRRHNEHIKNDSSWVKYCDKIKCYILDSEHIASKLEAYLINKYWDYGIKNIQRYAVDYNFRLQQRDVYYEGIIKIENLNRVDLYNIYESINELKKNLLDYGYSEMEFFYYLCELYKNK